MAKVNYLLKVLKRQVSYALWFLLEPSKFRKINTSKIKKILIINLGFIGDLLATTPMITALKSKFKAEIIVLIRKKMEDVLSDNPKINKVLTYQDNFQKDVQVLKSEEIDLAVIVWPATFKISLLCLKAGIPYRIGTTQTGLLESNGYFLTRMVKPSFYQKHKVQENLDISRLVNADLKNPKIEFYFSKKDEQFANKFLRKNKIRSFIVIHPGKRGKFYTEYSWPLKKFAEVADYLVERYKTNIIITGAKGEEKIAKEIIRKMKNKKAIIAVGKLNLKQFGALLKKARLLISIDTASVHLASAFGIPTIVLNAKYPKIWHPWMEKNKYKLLTNPKVNEVLKASSELLKK